MLAFAPWQILLDAIGWVLAQVYEVIPNYGISIIVVTLVIKLLLLPLGIKQIKSMQHMQAIQPKIKELQKKYKSNKTKQQEETMRLYKEAGVNPLGGCLPLLLQFPILIAMYSVLRPPAYEPVQDNGQLVAYEIVNNHVPIDSQLFTDGVSHVGTSFLAMNLQCTPSQVWSGPPVTIPATDGQDVQEGIALRADGEDLGSLSRPTLDCGANRAAAIPYGLILLFMTGTTFLQQWQMQKASPPGSASSQQQAILRIMPVMFLFFGINFPAGLIVYWTTSNLFQIGQQAVLIRAGHVGPDALEKRIEEQRARAEAGPIKPGFFGRMMAKAEQAAEQREKGSKPADGKAPGKSSGKSSGKSQPRPAKPGAAKPGNQLKRKPGGGGR